MPVETLTEFPLLIVAGDTVRATLSFSDFPSSDWSLSVILRSAIASYPFKATAGSGDSYGLVLPAAKTQKIPPGLYALAYVYSAGGDRQTIEDGSIIQVFGDPANPGAKSVARQTLENMEAALAKISKNPRLSANFSGHTFTNRNLSELQEAIARQRGVVQAEDANLIPSGSGGGRILHPI